MAYLHPDKKVSVQRILTKGKKKKQTQPHPGLVHALAQKLYAERQGAARG